MTVLPSLFVSHGAPTFAIEPGHAGALLTALGSALGKPKGIVIVSPHWMTRGVEIIAGTNPETIHDFGPFSPDLYRIRYTPPGSPALAGRVAKLLSEFRPSLDATRGLDHGAWVPLVHMYPDADVPVIQVSLPFNSSAAQAFTLGLALAPLRGEGALIIGSGSLTHNLHEFTREESEAAEYAIEFTQWIRNAVERGDNDALLHSLERAPHARRAHPTTEHFMPLLVALGAASGAGPVTVLDGGIRHGVISMESYVFGRSIVLPVRGGQDA